MSDYGRRYRCNPPMLWHYKPKHVTMRWPETAPMQYHSSTHMTTFNNLAILNIDYDTVPFFKLIQTSAFLKEFCILPIKTTFKLKIECLKRLLNPLTYCSTQLMHTIRLRDVCLTQ